ncbi:ABC transporter permease [Streptomyces sp. NBC_00237]|uniref:ABC transporter permease n=1 Tax=Streptomyces sp. NBC_00237 TaxID=2975687 RepID=UPI00225A70E6|nr:ABC transporter permease [Streptomyces sp. NBC_00237]MCX5201807.1 ABC transporter permease [Streptomyces sp. NBC_00237]
MTAPLTPPHQPSPHDPWQTPEGYGDGATQATYPPIGGGRDSGELATDIRKALVVLVVTAVAGLLLGVLWAWLAPKVPLISTDKAVFLKDTEGEAAAGADGVFVLLSLGLGLLTGLGAFLFHRRGGIPMVVALALGALMGAWLGWMAGGWFGPSADVVAQAKAVGVGVAFDAPLKLGAKGALLAWPFGAVLVHLGLTAVWGVRDPEPEFEWGAYYGAPAQAPVSDSAPGQDSAPVSDAAPGSGPSDGAGR